MTQSPTDLTDEELARRAQAGSSSCFEELVRRFQVPLLRFLLRRLSCQCDAEDVLQESFVRAYQNLHQYQASRPFKPWLFTITYRLAISHTRRTHLSPTTDSVSDLSGTSELPLHRLTREEQRTQLWQVARDVLTPEQYSAVWLYYVEEMKAGEIAQVLGRSWVAVKTMLHRSRKRLLPHLAAFQEGETSAEPSFAAARRAAFLRKGETPAPQGEAPARESEAPPDPIFTAKAGEA